VLEVERKTAGEFFAELLRKLESGIVPGLFVVFIFVFIFVILVFRVFGGPVDLDVDMIVLTVDGDAIAFFVATITNSPALDAVSASSLVISTKTSLPSFVTFFKIILDYLLGI
jgi:hypothetical protein